MRPTTRSCASAASTLAKPTAAFPALWATARASSADRSISRSVDSTRSGATRTSRRKPLAKALRASARLRAGRVAVIQTPRPGSRRLRSGTTAPSGATTKRIISATGLTAPVAAQKRSVPARAARGPLSSPSCCGRACIGVRVHGSGLSFAGLSGGVFGGRRRRQILLLDPAGFDTRLHDQRLGVLTRELEPVEDAGVLHGLAVLALRPADQVVGDGAGQVLDRLDAVLAQMHQHLGGDAGDLLERILDAEFLAFAVEFGLFLVQEFARTGLELAGGLLVEAFDAGKLLIVDHQQFFDRLEAFRCQQLADHLVDVERIDEQLGALLELGLPMLRLLLLGDDVDVPPGEL